jgi:hypothetical protein
VLALMAASASATNKPIEAEGFEEAGIAIQEQALRMAEEGEDKNDANSASDMHQRPLDTEADLEDCGALLGSRFLSGRKKRRRAGDHVLTPLELLHSRGRSAVFVTEICSQVVPPHPIAKHGTRSDVSKKQEWCELQLDFTLRLNKGRQPETAEMTSGRER